MFDFDAGKLLIIGIVALVFIPSKDLPRVLRQLGQFTGKMRRMASEFQSQFMDAMREADLAELKREAEKLAKAAEIDPNFPGVRDAVEPSPALAALGSEPGPPGETHLAETHLAEAHASVTKVEPDLHGETAGLAAHAEPTLSSQPDVALSHTILPPSHHGFAQGKGPVKSLETAAEGAHVLPPPVHDGA